MKYSRFEDLPVWQAAMGLSLRIDGLLRDRAFRRPGDLADQLARAALSVSNNIAEGFERGSTNELLMFIYIARGSAGEVRSMLRWCERHGDCTHLKSQISDLISLGESCSKQLRGWADSLQNGDIQGQRHLTDRTRAAWERKQRSEQFMAKLRRLTPHLHPEAD
jgi:four helix bundle protein